jgi:hypothetical protein
MHEVMLDAAPALAFLSILCRWFPSFQKFRAEILCVLYVFQVEVQLISSLKNTGDRT